MTEKEKWKIDWRQHPHYNPMPDAPPLRWGDDLVEPGPGSFLVIHHNHDGTSFWMGAKEVRDRLKTIRTVKPEEERPSRLRNLGIVPWSASVMEVIAEYQSRRDALFKDHQSRRDALDKEYQPRWDALDKELVAKLKPMSVEEWERLQGGKEKAGGVE